MKQFLLDRYFSLKCAISQNHPGRLLNSIAFNKLAYPNGQEPKVIEAASKFSGVIWDVGAHVGCFADRLASRPDTRVVCFECNHGVLPLLTHNMRNRPNVTIVPMALWDGFPHEAMDDLDFKNKSTNKCLCATLSVQMAFGLFPKPDLIKMDVEGAEYHLLQNELFHKCNLIVEWHDHIPWEELSYHWHATLIDDTHTLLKPHDH